MAHLDEALLYKPEGRGFDSLLEYFLRVKAAGV